MVPPNQYGPHGLSNHVSKKAQSWGYWEDSSSDHHSPLTHYDITCALDMPLPEKVLEGGDCISRVEEAHLSSTHSCFTLD